jgi:hypothetical protein
MYPHTKSRSCWIPYELPTGTTQPPANQYVGAVTCMWAVISPADSFLSYIYMYTMSTQVRLSHMCECHDAWIAFSWQASQKTQSRSSASSSYHLHVPNMPNIPSYQVVMGR